MDISYAVGELRSRRELRRFLEISEVPTADSLYRFLSRFDETQFVSLIPALLNSCGTHRRKRGYSTFLINGTAIILDLNGFRRTFTKKQLEQRE